MENKEEIFRKKSLENVSTPEELSTIIKVTKPGIWIFLGAVIALLIGALVWAFVGEIEVKFKSGALVENHIAYVYVKEEIISKIAVNQIVRLEGKEGKIENVATTPIQITEETREMFGDYLLHLADLKVGDFVYEIKTEPIELDANVYQAEIVTQKLSPISLLFQ